LAGTHPYWLNVACSLLYEAKMNERIDLKELKQQFEREFHHGQVVSTRRRVQQVTDNTVVIRVSALLAVVGLVVGWLSMQASSPIGIFFGGGLLLIALGLLINDWFQESRRRREMP
jgi:hypothetical protein